MNVTTGRAVFYRYSTGRAGNECYNNLLTYSTGGTGNECYSNSVTDALQVEKVMNVIVTY